MWVGYQPEDCWSRWVGWKQQQMRWQRCCSTAAAQPVSKVHPWSPSRVSLTCWSTFLWMQAQCGAPDQELHGPKRGRGAAARALRHPIPLQGACRLGCCCRAMLCLLVGCAVGRAAAAPAAGCGHSGAVGCSPCCRRRRQSLLPPCRFARMHVVADTRCPSTHLHRHSRRGRRRPRGQAPRKQRSVAAACLVGRANPDSCLPNWHLLASVAAALRQ